MKTLKELMLEQNHPRSKHTDSETIFVFLLSLFMKTNLSRDSSVVTMFDQPMTHIETTLVIEERL